MESLNAASLPLAPDLAVRRRPTAPPSHARQDRPPANGVYIHSRSTDPTLGGLFEGAENLPTSNRRGETTSSHSNPAGATFARISSAAIALEEADPHRLLTVGTSEPRVIQEWIARFKRFGTRSTLHALSLEDILILQEFTGVGTTHYAVDPRRRCPTNAEIQALVKQNRKLTIERLWRRLRPLDFSSSNLGSLTTRANSNDNNSNDNHNHNQRGRGSRRGSGSVLGGENGESSDAESEEEEDDGMDGEGNVRARAPTAPKKGPKSKENKAEQLRLELLGDSISRKLFEPRAGAPQDPLRQLRVENEHALYAGQPLNTANSERQQLRKFCIWMAAQDLEEPGRFDRIDGKRIFDYMQFIGSPRDETGSYYSANTIKLHLTMVNRFKARQEAARGVPEPSPDELHWSKTTLKVLNQLYKTVNKAGHNDPDNNVLKNTPAEYGIYTLKDHWEASLSYLRVANTAGKFQFGNWVRRYAMVLTGLGTLARGNTVGNIRLCHMVSWHLNLSSQRDRSLIVREAEDQPEAATQWGMMVIQVSSKHLHNARKEGGKDVNGMVPHKWSALCPIGALMVYSHWQYDSFNAFESDEATEQGPKKKRKADTKATFFTRARESEAASFKSEGELLREIDWFDPATIRHIRFFGNKSNVALAPDAKTIGECWTQFKVAAGIISPKAGHYARFNQPRILEEMGCRPDEIKRLGQWRTNDTCAEIYMDPMPPPGVLALAGFKRDEPYVVPRLRIQAPEHLQRLVFPWLCEPNLASAIADTETRTALDGRQLDEGTWRHLKLLSDMRSYLIVHLADLYQRIPSSPLFTHLPLFNTGHRDEVLAWMKDDYPRLLAIAQREAFERPDLLAHVYNEDERRYRQHMESRFSQMLNMQFKLCEEFQAFSARHEPVADQPRVPRPAVVVQPAPPAGAGTGPTASSPGSGAASTTHKGPNYRLPGPDAFCQPLTPTEIRKLGDTPAGDFDWRVFIEKVDVPQKLWPLYKPHQIGDYKSVEQMVLDWTAVRTVDHGHSEPSEQLPPLSLLDEVFPQFDSEVMVVHKWIAQKSAEQAAGSSLGLLPTTPKKRIRPSSSSPSVVTKGCWRPGKDGSVSKLWSKYANVIRLVEYRAIQVAGRNGRSAVNSIARAEVMAHLKIQETEFLSSGTFPQFVDLLSAKEDCPKRSQGHKGAKIAIPTATATGSGA